MWPSDEKEMMRLLRENNAMLKQILQILASGGNSAANNFLVDVLANLTADGISRG
jgi:hypothetical protein